MHYDHPEEISQALDILTHIDVVKGIILFTEDLDALWNDFKNQFEWIEAAGGLVTNESGESLLIFRNGKWDLPKGKLEAGESIEVGAMREVEEECGINDLELGKHITDTYHIYSHKGKEVLKCTYWYKMTSSQVELIPQTEEGITEVCWKRINQEAVKKLDTYENIRLVFEAGLD